MYQGSFRTVSVFLAFLFFASNGLAVPVFLFGGGDRPNEAMQDFVRAGGSQILVITWATRLKQESFEAIQSQLFRNSGKHQMTVSHATEPIDEATRSGFLLELQSASAVFISGGDQNHALDITEKFNLFQEFQMAHIRGVVFAGTSAGTAMLPNFAMTGESDLTKIEAGNTDLRRGLGVVPFLVDQHFIKRYRQNRLMSALIDHSDLKGVGIDEDNAVRYEDDKLMAYGKSPAMVYAYDSIKSVFCVELLNAGSAFTGHGELAQSATKD